MKRYLIIFCILLSIIGPAFSDVSAEVKSVSGKVEIKVPGGNWTSVSTGMNLSSGTIISTGFNASVVLEVNNATINVKQLTRMELSEILEAQGNVSTNLFLNFGKIEADIVPRENIEHNFTIKSPICTAAVRGTTIVMEPVKVDVLAGDVEVSNNLGQTRSIGAGESMTITGNSMPDSSEDSNLADFNVDPSTDPTGGDPGDDIPDTDPTTIVNIEIVWP